MPPSRGAEKPGGIGFPADPAYMFSDGEGNPSPAVERRQRRLAARLPLLEPLLEDGERVRWIATGYSPFRRPEQLLSGSTLLYVKRCMLVWTDRRILHLATQFDLTPRNSVAEIRYRDCRAIRIHRGGLLVEYKTGRHEQFRYLERSDRKKIPGLLEDASFEGAPDAARERVHLCPRCAHPLEPGRGCAGCQLEFKDAAQGRLRALLVPGGGYFYTRHPFLGIADALIESVLLVLFVVSLSETLGGVAEAVPVLFGSGFFLALEKAVSVYHTEQLLAEFVPRPAKIAEEPAAVPRPERGLLSRVSIGAGASVLLAGMAMAWLLGDAEDPLITAARTGDVAGIHEALESGAALEVREPEHGATALMLAAGAGRTAAVRTLLDAGASLGARDARGWTALVWGAQSGAAETVRVLLGAGADIDAAASDGMTALLLAAENGHAHTVTQLLEAGARMDAADVRGMTPLMAAAIQGHTETFLTLAEAGADIEARGGDGVTFLMEAGSAGRIDIVRMLLELGANSDARDVDGWTPLMWAAVGGHAGVVEELLRAGANPAARNNDSATALDLAERAGQQSVIGVLKAVNAAMESR